MFSVASVVNVFKAAGAFRKYIWKSEQHSASKQPFLLLQVPEGSDIGEREGNAVLVFVAHRAKCKAPELEADAAAIVVIAHLKRAELHETSPDVVGCREGGAHT